jgi:hypothetical protein
MSEQTAVLPKRLVSPSGFELSVLVGDRSTDAVSAGSVPVRNTLWKRASTSADATEKLNYGAVPLSNYEATDHSMLNNQQNYIRLDSSDGTANNAFPFSSSDGLLFCSTFLAIKVREPLRKCLGQRRVLMAALGLLCDLVGLLLLSQNAHRSSIT